MTNRSPDAISGYHAHIYYDAGTKEKAARLREALGERFAVERGRWHDRPIGPHPRWSYQVAFEPAVFADLVPWLALNRDGLVVLVHPRTGDDIADHRDFTIWLGEKVELDLSVLE
jgi:DOPA 4,5-dioxygenase